MPIKSVADAVREQKAGSDHIRTREQAVAVGLRQERKMAKRKTVTRRMPRY